MEIKVKLWLSWKLLRICVIACMVLNVSPSAWGTNFPTATVTILESKNATPSSGTMTISFGSTFVETIHYGQFSTPASIASTFASIFSSDPVSTRPRLCTNGICAKAFGATIVFQLVNAASSFGTFNYASNAIIGTNTFSAVLSPNNNLSYTVVTLSANPANSIFGMPITLTAMVQPSTVTGILSFQDNNLNLIANVRLINGVGSVSTSKLQPGHHAVTAIYDGDYQNSSTASSPISIVVSGQANSLAITNIVPSIATIGTIVTLQGTSFGSVSSSVLLNSNLIQPLIWNDTMVVFQVPSGAVTGPVTLSVAGNQSNSVLLTISGSPLSCPTH